MPSKKVNPAAPKAGLPQRLASIHPALWAVWVAIIGVCVAGWWFHESGTESAPAKKDQAAAPAKPAFSSFVTTPPTPAPAAAPVAFPQASPPPSVGFTPPLPTPGQPPQVGALPSPEELAKIQPPPDVAAGLAHPPPEILEGLRHPPPEMLEGLKHPPPWVKQQPPAGTPQPPAAPGK